MLTTAAVSRGTIVIATIVMSHLLAPRDLGRILYFLATSTTGSILIAQGTSTAVLSIMGRMLPARRRAASRALFVVYAFAALMALLLAGALLVAGPRVLPDLGLLAGQPTFALLAASIALQGMIVLTLGALAGLEAFRAQSALSIGSALAQYGLLVAGAALGRVELGLAMAVGAMAVSLLVILAVALRLGAARAMRFDRRSCALGRRRRFGHGILGFVALTTIGAMLFEPVNWLCVSLLLGHPDGAAQVAAYLAANQWFAIILFVPINLTQVTLPLVSRAFRETGRVFGAAARRMLAISFAASTAVGALLLIAMPLLLRLYSTRIAAAMPVFAIIAVNGMIVSIQVATGQVLVAAGRVRANLLFNAGWAALFLLLSLLTVSSAVGLAASRLAAYALHAAGVLAFLLMVDRRAARAAG